MELIGQWCLWDSTKPVRDAAAALVFPAIEPAIPEAIDEALQHHRPGAWDHHLLTAPRIFRLEVLQASQPHHSFQETLREVWHVWRHAGLVLGRLPSSSALAQANHQLRWQPDQHDRIFRLLAEMIRNQPLDVRPGRAEPRRKRPDRRPYPVFKTPRADWRRARKAG